MINEFLMINQFCRMTEKLNIIFAFALKAEWEFLKKKYTLTAVDSHVFAFKDHRSVFLAQLGVGRCGVEKNFSGILQRLRPCLVVHMGVSGALREDLLPGEAFIPVKIVSSRGMIAVDEALIQTHQAHLPQTFHRGTLFTSETVLKNRQEKIEASCQHLARAVDMESYNVAHLCAENAVPYIPVRHIFDTVGEDLENLSGTYGDAGEIKMKKMVANLIKHPKLIFQLSDFRRRLSGIQQEWLKIIDGFL